MHLKSSLRKFYGGYLDLIEKCNPRMLNGIEEYIHKLVHWYPPSIRYTTNLTKLDIVTEFDLILYPVPFETCICSILKLVMFWDCVFRSSLVLLLYFCCLLHQIMPLWFVCLLFKLGIYNWQTFTALSLVSYPFYRLSPKPKKYRGLFKVKSREKDTSSSAKLVSTIGV